MTVQRRDVPDGFCDVGLAHAVRPHQHVDARGEGDVRGFIATEVREFEVEDLHGDPSLSCRETA